MSENECSVSVSCEFIEKYMPEANPYFTKVYLYSLSLSDRDGIAEVSLTEAAESLHMLATDIVLAFDYWSTQGILELTRHSQNSLLYTLRFRIETKQQEISDEAVSDQPLVKKKRADKEIKDMFRLAQTILGRPLSPSDAKTLYSFYDWLGMPVNVILMLLEYCVSISDTKMSFIEKTAISWHEMGLTTVAAAEAYIMELGRKEAYFEELKTQLGIEKTLTQNEKKYFSIWLTQYHSSPELVALAGEYCAAQIGRVQLPYMNAILKSWCEKGITTPDEARRGNESFRQSRAEDTAFAKKPYQKFQVYSGGDYDYDEISKIAAQKLNHYAQKKEV
jgi:DnaD/phage-associated family protein